MSVGVGVTSTDAGISGIGEADGTGLPPGIAVGLGVSTTGPATDSDAWAVGDSVGGRESVGSMAGVSVGVVPDARLPAPDAANTRTQRIASAAAIIVHLCFMS